MKRRVLALAVLIAGCGSATDPASSPPSTITQASVVTAATTTTYVVTASETPDVATTTTTTTTTTVPYPELMITGTGKVYTLEESPTRPPAPGALVTQ